MARLKRDDVVKAQDVPREVIDVPEWGGEMEIRGLNAAAGQRVANAVSEDPDGVKWRCIAVALSCVDESGALLFDELDVQMLAEKSWAAVLRVSDAILRLSRARQVEKHAENF